MSHEVRPCIVGDCEPSLAPGRYRRGMCPTHYTRWLRHGDPNVVLKSGVPKIYGTDLAGRFWPKVDKRGADECWPWLAYTDDDGYGKFSIDASADCAHRVAWILTRGPIPDGLTIDHTCHDPDTCQENAACPHRRCQNPDHMTTVTGAANRRRAVPHGRTNAPRGANGQFLTGSR